MEKAYRNVSGLFIVVLAGIFWGFHKPYTSLFPEFKGYVMTHHIHGALMMMWILMLIVQPLLIRAGRTDIHRTLGKFAWVLGPALMIYLFLIARVGFQRDIQGDAKEAYAIMVLNIRGLFAFAILYALAMYNRKRTPYHMRYMIGTGLLAIGPGFGRALIFSYGYSLWDALAVTDYIAIGITAILLAYDIYKRNVLLPYTIVLFILCTEAFLWYHRFSGPWQSFAAKYANLFF
jgi:hypothetical protein